MSMDSLVGSDDKLSVLEIGLQSLRATKQYHEQVMAIHQSSRARQRELSHRLDEITASATAFLNKERPTYYSVVRQNTTASNANHLTSHEDQSTKIVTVVAEQSNFAKK